MVSFAAYKHLWESIEGYWRKGEGTQIPSGVVQPTPSLIDNVEKSVYSNCLRIRKTEEIKSECVNYYHTGVWIKEKYLLTFLRSSKIYSKSLQIHLKDKSNKSNVDR